MDNNIGTIFKKGQRWMWCQLIPEHYSPTLQKWAHRAEWVVYSDGTARLYLIPHGHSAHLALKNQMAKMGWDYLPEAKLNKPLPKRG